MKEKKRRLIHEIEALEQKKHDLYDIHIAPIEKQKKECEEALGELLAGLKPGDIATNRKKQRVRVVRVWQWIGFDNWCGKAVNILKRGEEGQERMIYCWDDWKKEEAKP